MRYLYGVAHEQFPPRDGLRHAVLAEQAGFDGICCSDHFQPWWEPGESGHAWIWLGAAAQATERVPVGPAVTPALHRYHPALVAQAFATLEQMYPGRAFLGLGSGESLNESPLGLDWPSPEEQLEALDEAAEIIRRLWNGETLDTIGRFRMKQARLHTLPERSPPLYISAFHEGAAEVAARRGDGLWTLGDPELAPPVIEAYRAARREEGKDDAEIVVQGLFSWAETDETALEGARVWKGAQPPEFYIDDWHDPAAMYRRGEEQLSDEQFVEKLIIAADAETHVWKIRAMEELGATQIALLNVSGADPEAAIRFYGEQVLPALRG